MKPSFIFDLDGTLVDTLGDIRKCLNTVLERHGLGSRSVREVRSYIGDGALQLVKRAVGEGYNEEFYNTILEEYNREYDAHPTDMSKAYPGVTEALMKLKELGCKIAVLSNKPDKHTKLVVKKCLPGVKFNVVRGHIDGVPHKPDPEPALRVAAEMGVEPSDVWFIGDSDTDMRTAVNAGMHSANVTWGYRTREQLESAGQSVFCVNADSLILFARGYKQGIDTPLKTFADNTHQHDEDSLFGVLPSVENGDEVYLGNNVCAFTGHRPEKLGITKETDPECISLMIKLEAEIRQAVKDGYDTFLTGMANGVDIWAAISFVRVKKYLTGIGDISGSSMRMCAVLPYKNFEGRGYAWQKERYRELLENCDRVIVISDVYTNDCMRRRNEFLVQHSRRLIAVYNGTPGGTEMTVNLARENGLDVRIIKP